MMNSVGQATAVLLVVLALAGIGVVLTHHVTAILRRFIEVASDESSVDSGVPSYSPQPRTLITRPPEETTQAFARIIALPWLGTIIVISGAAVLSGSLTFSAPNVVGSAITSLALLISYLVLAVKGGVRHSRLQNILMSVNVALLAITVAANAGHAVLSG